MELAEAIEHLQETLNSKKHKWSCKESRDEHEQLLDFLLRLKEYETLEKEFIHHYGVGLEMTVHKMSEFHDDLADYIQLKKMEESGRLIKLPCAVGDTIWVIGVMGIDKAEPYKVTCITYRRDKQENNGVYVYASGRGQISFFADEECGRTVFLTREAAEAKLKEMEGDNIE